METGYIFCKVETKFLVITYMNSRLLRCNDDPLSSCFSAERELLRQTSHSLTSIEEMNSFVSKSHCDVTVRTPVAFTLQPKETHPNTERKMEAQEQNETLEWNERKENNKAGITHWARCYRNLNKSITGPRALLRFMKVSTLLLKKAQTSWLPTQSPKSMFLFRSKELIGGTSRALTHARVPEGGSIYISKQKPVSLFRHDLLFGLQKATHFCLVCSLLVPLKRGKRLTESVEMIAPMLSLNALLTPG
jgi:hypothetical protein